MLHYKQLVEFGLEDKEAKIYLSTLELGGESVLQIAKKAKLNRVSTYDALRTLTNTGLISSFTKGKRVHYRAANPDRLGYLLNKQKHDITRAEKSLKKLMPELSSFFNNKDNKPRVIYYEGKEGLKTIQDSFLKTPDKLLRVIYLYDNVKKVFSDEERQLYKSKRKKLGIEVRAVVVYKDKDIDLPKREKFARRVYLPFSKYPIKSDITIYHHNIAIVSLDQMFGIVIESIDIVDTMRIFFDLTWNMAKKNK